MKITGGEACGRSIAVPKIHAVRPTGSKMRQALFNILGKKIRQANVLDLFAGSGMMGFEALSRGASSLTSVEKNFFCARCLDISAQKLGYTDRIKIIRNDFRQAIENLKEQQFDIIFADPPYKSGFIYLIPKLISENNVLKKEGVLILEHPIGLEFNMEDTTLCLAETRPYSQSAFSFFCYDVKKLRI